MKAFISHRSTDKELARKIVEIARRDNCVLDEFDFYPGQKTMDEIVRNLEHAPIFVLLISRAAIESEWVKSEMAKAKSLYNERKIKDLLPFIIEDDLEIEDVPAWISRDWAINVKKISSPRIIAQFVIEAQRRQRCEVNPRYGQIINSFIGRRDELDEFQRLIFDSVDMPHRALVVSGKPGSGRTRFIQKCIQDNEHLQFVPEGFRIKLPQKTYLDHFLLQLHDGLGYSAASYQDIMKLDYGRQVATAVTYINEIINAHSFLLIEDEMAFVQYDGTLPQWVKDILAHPALIDSLKIYVSSRVRPRVYELRQFPQLIHINLQGFNGDERRRIFINFCRYHGVNMPDRDVDYFVDHLQSSPQQLETAVKYIKEHNVVYARKHIDELKAIGDELFSRVFSVYKGNDMALTLARVLAEIDMMSFEQLEQLYEEDFDKVRDLVFEFESLSILDFYGPGGYNISLDGGVADYMRRSRELDVVMKNRLQEVVYDKIDTIGNSEGADELSELSVYLYSLRKQLLSGTGIAYIMPSLVISTIIRLYDQGEYEDVKKICLHALEQSASYPKEPLQELYYRLCQVLARLKDEMFFKYVKFIEDRASQDFLYGFYYRYQEDYTRAEEYLKKALEGNSNMQVARRELVNVYLNQPDFGKALPWAKENYENKKSNTYHIEAYFRCLVSKFPWSADDERILKQLLHEMQNNYSKKKDEMLAAMQLEYDIKSRSYTRKEIDKKIKAALAIYPHSPQLHRIIGEYNKDVSRYTVKGKK